MRGDYSLDQPAIPLNQGQPDFFGLLMQLLGNPAGMTSTPGVTLGVMPGGPQGQARGIRSNLMRGDTSQRQWTWGEAQPTNAADLSRMRHMDMHLQGGPTDLQAPPTLSQPMEFFQRPTVPNPAQGNELTSLLYWLMKMSRPKGMELQ
jgi:hypothetical protein